MMRSGHAKDSDRPKGAIKGSATLGGHFFDESGCTLSGDPPPPRIPPPLRGIYAACLSSALEPISASTEKMPPFRITEGGILSIRIDTLNLNSATFRSQINSPTPMSSGSALEHS